MSRLSFLCTLLLFPLAFLGQEFGGTPPSQKWEQIDTDTARIIFPESYDSLANRISAIIHRMAAGQPAPLGGRLRKINIVLQHQTTIGNGYVGLGPYRSEFFLTPITNNFQEGSISWADQLAIHEYRHVQQYNNFHNGISKAMYYLFGEEGFAVATNASVPDWFYEGDAVYQETLLTRQGRGRLPLFLNAFPSLWREGKPYSWMKLRNGSLKDYVPSHYHLGYLLVNYGREKYGMEFWQKVTRDASAFKGLFYPMQKAVKRHAGVDYATFRKEAFEYYQQLENARTAKLAIQDPGKEWQPVNKNYVNSYYHPFPISGDSLLYLKTSYRHRPAFMIRDQKGEHRLRVRDISIDQHFSYRNGRIVYAAFKSDPRWGWRDFSDIRVLDVQTGKQRNLTRNSKYFMPDISASGNKVAAVHIRPGGKSELHILDAGSGNLLQSIRSSDILLFTGPRFLGEDSVVTAVRLRDGRMALAVSDVKTGVSIRLTPPSFQVVGNPYVHEGVIYFTAAYGGNDDLFALRMADRSLYRISRAAMGQYFPSVGYGRINWSAFTADGYQLRQLNLNELEWEPLTETPAPEAEAKFPVSQTASVQPFPAQMEEDRIFPVKRYRKSTRLLNFHSWRPYYEDPIFTYSLYGQNILNTLQTEIYYLYNQDEKTNAAGINAVYGGWFPWLHLGSEYTFDRQGLTATRVRRWDQLDTRAGLSVPLNFTGGRTYRNLNIGTFYVLRNEFNKGFFKDSIGNTSFSYLWHTLSFTQQVQRAVQHIYPRLAYSLSLNHRHAITHYEGYQAIANAAIYLPGVLNNHSLVFTGSVQQRDTLSALFSTRFAHARGYADYYRTTAGSRMWRLSGNYHLPLLHPDWGFGNILYLQRLRTNVFYDFQRLYSNDKRNHADLRSAGIELFVDTKWWNQYELSFGFRVSRLLDDDPLGGYSAQSHIFEFILPVSIIPR